MPPAKPEPLVKAERARMASVKAEVSVKREVGAAAFVLPRKQEHHPKVELKNESFKAKLEQQALQRRVKGEQSACNVASLVQRGLSLRAKAEQERSVKAELKKVKLERGKPKQRNGKGGKRRCTAARRNASREVMSRPVALSEELADVLGSPALSRPEAVKRLWAHCRERGMLNPEDKREIVFDETLATLFGKERARMTDLCSLLVPHFDYTRQPQAEGSETPASHKREMHHLNSKAEVSQPPAKREKKEEKLDAATKMETWDHEQKSEPGDQATTQPIVKLQQRSTVETVRAGADNWAAWSTAASPELSHICADAVTVTCCAPLGQQFRLCAVAKTTSPDEEVIQVYCCVDFQEDVNGAVQPMASARLEGLRSPLAYSISVEIHGLDGGLPLARSTEVLLPQRAHASKWSTKEVMQWCASLQVPELVQKAREYAIDGATLLSLGEEDLQALGLAAPFLRRRVLTGLKDLRPKAA